MHIKQFVLPIVSLGALALAIATRVGGQEPASVPSFPTYEYMVIDPDDKGGDGERRGRLQAQLTPLGKEGWELVEMPYLKGIRYQVMVLKRPIR